MAKRNRFPQKLIRKQIEKLGALKKEGSLGACIMQK